MLKEEFGVKTRDEWNDFNLVGLERLGKVREAEVEVVRSWTVELVGEDCRAYGLIRVAPCIWRMVAGRLRVRRDDLDVGELHGGVGDG